MHLVVGLGNPGKEYVSTRHNIGFMVLDALADTNRLSFKDTKWQALLAKGQIWNSEVLLAKPQTYMNLSGQAVRALVDFYRIDKEQIVVIHDDLDIPLGQVKIVHGRGPGGHNGIRSIIDHLGGKDFIRIRLGIGRPALAGVTDYVLSRFNREDEDLLRGALAGAEEGLRLVLQEGLAVAMNRINAA